MNSKFQLTEEFALAQDQADRLHKFRDRFYLLKDTIYMDGNSLGLFSKDAESALLRAMEEHKHLAINGWTGAEKPWFTAPEELAKSMAKIVGAKDKEVIITGGTTINMHNLLAGFYKPSGKRRKLLLDELNFPSDLYAAKAHIDLHDLSEEDFVLVKSRDGRNIDERDIIDAMTEEIAVAVFPSVLYRSGQLLNIQLLTKKAHEKGILIGFDCCHSAGAVPHKLHDWGVDFAFWCNYKYLNGGPGAIGSLFVHEKHFHVTPGLPSWHGVVKDKVFDMVQPFEAEGNAGAWQMTTIPLFSFAPLQGSLQIFEEAGMGAIRSKSLHQTEYMMYLIDSLLTGEPYNFSIGTLREDERRGGHVALEHDEAIRINTCMKENGIIPDFRFPNVIRLAPIALYTSYHEIWRMVQTIRSFMESKEYMKYDNKRGTVA